MPRKRRNPRPARPYIKPGVSGERFQEDTAFANSRRASTEFADAARCASLIRRQFMEMLEDEKQNEIHKRLTKLIAPIIRKARVPNGERINLNHIQWDELKGIEFNMEESKTNLVRRIPEVTVHMSSGNIVITHPPVEVEKKVLRYTSITHIRLVAGAAAIDFQHKTAVNDYTAIDPFPKNQPPLGEVVLSLDLRAPVMHPLFVVLGVISYKKNQSGELLTELGNRRFKALSIIRVVPVDEKNKKK